MGDFRNLDVWQRAADLAAETYRLTSHFPQQERYGLTNQMRRAAVSVSSNIAEGAGRSRAEFRRFLGIARGSLHELHSQVLVAQRLGFAEAAAAMELVGRIERISRMLLTLIRYLSRRPQPRSNPEP